jgi:hypothetical protein
MLGNFRCDLLSFNGFDHLSGYLPIETKSIGLWCFESDTGDFYDLRDYSFDSKFNAARALGVITLGLGWIVIIFYAVACCCRFPPLAFTLAIEISKFNVLFQGLVFLLYKSKVCTAGCRLDSGGKCAVSAVVLWFLSGLTFDTLWEDAEKSDGPSFNSGSSGKPAEP